MVDIEGIVLISIDNTIRTQKSQLGTDFCHLCIVTLIELRKYYYENNFTLMYISFFYCGYVIVTSL